MNLNMVVQKDSVVLFSAFTDWVSVEKDKSEKSDIKVLKEGWCIGILNTEVVYLLLIRRIFLFKLKPTLHTHLVGFLNRPL